MVIGERNKGSVQTDGRGTNLREAWKTLLWRTWEQVLVYGRSDTKKSFCLLQVFGSQNSQNVSTATLTRKDGGPGPLAGNPHHPIPVSPHLAHQLFIIGFEDSIQLCYPTISIG
jgi:hypothetical protein